MEDPHMRKVNLTMKEKYRYKVIKKLVDTNGNKKSAELKLGCSRRTVDRLIKNYKENGKSSFSHGNKNREPSNKLTDDKRKQIIKLYKEVYHNANFLHFSQLLAERENISISHTSINSILLGEYIVSPKATRATKRKVKRILKNKQNQVPAQKKDTLATAMYLLDEHEAHPRRERVKNFGELIQMDASVFNWFGNIETHLHLAIDDATGIIVGGWFDTQETLKGYYNVFKQILVNYGIPHKFLTDNRTIFNYIRKNAPSDQEDTFTQFSYSCHQLGVEIDTTSVPQAKGRVERLNQTLQSRLVIEMKLDKVSTIKHANLYLMKYIEKFNRQFGLTIPKEDNVFEPIISEENIDLTLAIISKRIIDNASCIKYNNKYYMPTTSNNNPVHHRKGSQALVIEAFDGKQYINVNDVIYNMTEIPSRQTHSKVFDSEIKSKPRKTSIPPLTHPWRQASVEAYMLRQKHRPKDSAYV